MPRRRGGLRLRVAATFAAGGLVLSAVLAILTYTLCDHYLTQQRERSASRQAYVFARSVRDDKRRGSADEAVLTSLELPTGSSVVLHEGGRWSTTDDGLGRDRIPASFRRAVAAGIPVHQRVEIRGHPALLVGLPLPGVRAEFFMAFSLSELESTLDVLRATLLGAAGLTTAAAAVVGLWAARRVLRPLGGVSSTARSIAAGDLAARLDSGDDPDLTELTDAFNTMVAALQTRVERDARFASDVSHELRSPLTTLTSALSVLNRRRGELSARGQEALDLLDGEVRRFERLLKELLELARAESRTEEIQLEPVHIRDLVEQAARAVVPSPVVTVDPELIDLPVMVDKRRVNRIVTNLLTNAELHANGAVSLGVVRDACALRIQVDDNGAGVPVAEREAIFDRFFRGAAAGRRGSSDGTGLGLALVAEHVRLLGGRVWVEDGPMGAGARFVVELPLRTS